MKGKTGAAPSFDPAKAESGVPDTLTNVTIPLGVNSIGEDAFAYCYDLAEATIPDSVTDIGDYAFYQCGSLTRATLGRTRPARAVAAAAYSSSE